MILMPTLLGGIRRGAVERLLQRQNESLDLFRELEIAERRRHHLRLVIRRKARRLSVYVPSNLEALSEADLSAIRLSLSKQIARRETAHAAGSEIRKTNMKSKMYRQGDVLVERVAKLPDKIKRVRREGGKIILARGEATGHHHFIADEGCALLEAPETPGDRFLVASGRSISTRLPIVRRWKNQVLVSHPKFGMVEFSIDDVQIVKGFVEIDGNFSLLQHQEHTTQAIPDDNYRLVKQREYSPTAIRNVAD